MVTKACVCTQVLKLLAEMSPFCGDMEKLESNLNMLFIKLLVRKTSVFVTRWRLLKRCTLFLLLICCDVLKF